MYVYVHVYLVVLEQNLNPKIKIGHKKYPVPFQSAVGGKIIGDFTFVSMKLSRTPRLQSLLDFLQFTLDPSQQ